jgi:hypothetical protein
MAAPSFTDRGGDKSRRNPIVVQEVIDTVVREDNFNAAMV